MSIQVLIKTADLTPQMRSLLDIYCDLFFQVPITVSGKQTAYQDVVRQLDEDTVDRSVHVGYGNAWHQAVTLEVKVEAEKYARAVQWLQNLMHHSVFTHDRIKVAVSKLISELPQAKRSGNAVCDVML